MIVYFLCSIRLKREITEPHGNVVFDVILAVPQSIAKPL